LIPRAIPSATDAASIASTSVENIVIPPGGAQDSGVRGLGQRG
jgi:hypothetical protein